MTDKTKRRYHTVKISDAAYARLQALADRMSAEYTTALSAGVPTTVAYTQVVDVALARMARDLGVEPRLSDDDNEN